MAVSGSVRGFSRKTPGKSRENCWKNVPESRNATNSRISGTGKGEPARNLGSTLAQEPNWNGKPERSAGADVGEGDATKHFSVKKLKGLVSGSGVWQLFLQERQCSEEVRASQ